MDTLRLIFGPLLSPAFTLWGSPVTWAEMCAFGLGLWMVERNIRVHPWGWPLAIASSALYALLFADSRLYGEAGLQGFFIVVSVWGWRQWLRGTEAGGMPLTVRTMPWRDRGAAAVITLAAWPALALLLSRNTDSDVPWLDALPTVASITGQWLLARKRVEAWAVWVVVNVYSVGLFMHKALWLTALLYAVFAVLSLVGWRAWHRLAQAPHLRP
jgi:nicotinamide mononucleotide transporter